MGKPLVGRCEEGSETAYHLVAIWTIVFSFVASFIYTYTEIPKWMTSGQVRLLNGPKESMPRSLYSWRDAWLGCCAAARFQSDGNRRGSVHEKVRTPLVSVLHLSVCRAVHVSVKTRSGWVVPVPNVV